jgi:serine/threonine protein kinase
VVDEKLDKIDLAEEGSESVLYVSDMLQWVEEKWYRNDIRRPPRFNPLQFLKDYESVFEGRAGKPAGYTVHGFRPDQDPMWVHPSKLYSEYKAKELVDPDKLALLRRWNFSALGTDLIGQGERGFIGLREQRVYEYVEAHDEELAKSLLRPLTRASEGDVTVDFEELYVLPPRIARLSEFANSTLDRLSASERVVLTKAVLERFARLHDLRVAHRDAGGHCIWVERAPRVIVSGFPAAHYPTAKTVGGFRDRVKVERADLPEDVGHAAEGTPYHRDVFHLAVLVHQLLYGERPPKVNGTYEFVARGDDAFEGCFNDLLRKALAREPGDRFENARAMLEAVNAAASGDSEQVIELSAFEAHKAKTRARDYPELEPPIVDDDDLLCYRSAANDLPVLVKEWHGVEPDTRRPDLAIRLLSFLERARNLAAAGLEGLPRIVDYGLSRRSLLLVQEWVEGVTLDAWNAADRPLEERLQVARSLTTTLSRMHELEWAHGDIKPQNVVVCPDGAAVFIDVLDFRRNTDEVYSTAYLPEDYKKLGPFDRDCYSLAAVLEELLINGRSGSELEPLRDIQEEILRLMVERSVMSLAPLESALLGKSDGELAASESYVLQVRNLGATGFAAGEIVSDNGSFHLSIENSRSRAGALRVHLVGPGARLTLEWDRDDKDVTWIGLRRIDLAEFVRSQNRSAGRVRARISVVDGHTSDGQSIRHEVENWVQEFAKPKAGVGEDAVVAVDEGVSPVSGEDNSARAGEELLPSDSGPSDERSQTRPIDVLSLWQALLAAEEEALPIATVTGDVHPNPRRPYQMLVPCVVDSSAFDPDTDDYAWVERQTNDGGWRRCGDLELRDTNLRGDPELAIERWSGRPPKVGDKLRLRSNMENASLSRRLAAVERILDGRSVVGNLADYFQPGESQPDPVQYREPTDEALDAYTLEDRSLNASQREAFKRAVSSGPLSLLQGPPGTGKTWFIACLLHYLVTKESARRILVVSQAHEAVNNALEKALELFQAKGMALNAVRLGFETSVSDTVKHLHSGALEQSYRERFKAEYKERVVRLAKDIGLSPEFAAEVVSLHTTLGHLANQIGSLDGDLDESEPKDAASENKFVNARTRRARLLETFEDICRSKYGYELGQKSVGEVVDELLDQIQSSHGVDSPQAIRRLKDLLALSDDWLRTLGEPSANFAEFLARSRTIVAGTLVGIGRRAAGVVQNFYDWVIIDEAARATPSELAVAMQAGRRILLVGDHKQLPPNFSEEVRERVAARLGVSQSSEAFHSDFERLFDSQYGRKAGASFQVQYRMAPAIGQLVSRSFYEKLETGRGKSTLLADDQPPRLREELVWVDTAPMGNRARENTSPDDKDCWNEGEANVVMGIVRQLLKNPRLVEKLCFGLAPGEPFMGIICMYSKQRDLLNRMKSQAHWIPTDLKRLIKVDTVDAYQGKENRLIIVSTVRNNPQQYPGFLRLPNRVNVALSRAMEKLIIVGSTRMWRGKNRELPFGKVLANFDTLVGEHRASVVNAQEFA